MTSFSFSKKNHGNSKTHSFQVKVETSAAQTNKIYNSGEGKTPICFDLKHKFKPGTFATVKGFIHKDAKRF